MKGIETERKPIRGKDLVLTVDTRLQRIITKAMAPHKSGAVVVVDVWTGAILGWCPSPLQSEFWSGRLKPKRKEEHRRKRTKAHDRQDDQGLFSWVGGQNRNGVRRLARR